jgi:hypothetical protein
MYPDIFGEVIAPMLERIAELVGLALVQFVHTYDKEISALTAVLLVIVTGGLIWVGYRQIWTSRAQLRAYVFVAGVRVTNVVEGDDIPEAIVAIKNFGQTPAYKVVNVSGIAVDRYPVPPTVNLTIANVEFRSPGRSRSDLGPTQSEHAITSAGRTLTTAERTAIANGDGVVIVYGEIRYIDAFGKRRRTKYRFMMGGPVGVRPGGQLVASEEGNEATQITRFQGPAE